MLRTLRASLALRQVASKGRLYSSSAPNEPDTKPDEKKQREAHLAALEKYYPPSLIKSILAAESAVTPELWATRQRAKKPFAPEYGDDFSEFHPLYDFARGEWVDKSEPRQPIPPQRPFDVAQDRDVMSGRSAAAVNLSNLEKLTGLRASYLERLVATPLIRKRVVNMTRLGKQSSFYAMVVVGDRNGNVGLGEGRDSQQAAKAVSHAHWDAVKNLKNIPRFEDRTIFGEVEHKNGAVVVNLRASAPGSGLRVHHIIYEICKVAGIKDLVGNVYRSRNSMNVAKTALEALTSKQVLADEIAVSRGKKVVDVTNTYFNF